MACCAFFTSYFISFFVYIQNIISNFVAINNVKCEGNAG